MRKFRLVIFLIIVAFVCISIGGCGGNGALDNSGNNNTNNDTNTNNNNNSGDDFGSQEAAVLDKIYDFDEDGIPDTLDFDDVAEFDYDKYEVIQSREISIPSRHYLKRLSVLNSPDSFIADFTAGIEYTVEISKGDLYQYPIGRNLPNVEIINSMGNTLSFDAGEDEESDPLRQDLIEHSVYPPDEPYVICFTFTPSVTGRYVIKLSQVVSTDNIYDDITLFVYKELRNEDTGEAGYYKRYKLYDEDGNSSVTISMNDVTALRQAFNDAANIIIEERIISEDEELSPETKTISQVQAYLDCVRNVKQYYGIFDDYLERNIYKDINNYSDKSDTSSKAEVTASASTAGGTKIPAEIYGIPYDSTKFLGDGFYAVTGAKSQYYGVRGGRFINLPVPRNKRLKALYKAGFISSKEDAEKFTTTTSETAAQLGGFGFGAGYLDNSFFKFGLTATTFVIHYEATEPKYRMLDDDENYTLTWNAQNILNNQGSKFFRYVFGDYFLGGYQYGTIYDAAVTITTKTTEQLDRVKTYLSAEFNSEAKAEKADIINKAKEFLKNNEAAIAIKIRTAGINGSGNVSTVDTDNMSMIASSLAEFREKSKQLSSANLSPVYVMLKRFRLLPAVFNRMREENDEGLIPLSSEHSKKVMNFRRDMVSMHSYYNVIRDTDNMDYSVKQRYKSRYENLLITINPPDKSETYSLFNEEYAAKMKSTHDDMLKLNAELKAMGDRNAFYKILMIEQDKERNPSSSVLDRPYGPSGGSIGYLSFMSSKAVQSDINAGSDFQDEKNTFTGSEWEPKFNAGSGYIFCYIKVIANNIHDKERKALPPNIGHQTADFFFKCGSSRWLEWKINLHSMRFNSTLYPFSGLQ